MSLAASPFSVLTSAAPLRRAAVTVDTPTEPEIPALITLINTLARERGRLFIQPIDPVSGVAVLETHLKAIAENQTEVVLVAKSGRELIGLINGTRGAHPARHGVLELGIGVLPQHRARGVGSALLAAIERWAHAADCHRLSLSVVVSNTPAIGLYRKFGFEVEGMRTASAMLDSEAIDELLMGKQLRRAAEAIKPLRSE